MSNEELTPKRNCDYKITLLLCFFLGAFGLHRFYVGKKGSGIAMLVMAITGVLYPISALWQLRDTVVISLNKFTDANGNELEHHSPGCGLLVLVVLIASFIVGGISSVFTLLSFGH